jgi:hypothetical protein
MRDNYVGDIGDYFKYGLLRALCGTETGIFDVNPLTLGVIWYLYNDICKPGDGNHLAYLQPEKAQRFRPYDPELFDSLAKLVSENRRSVKTVQQENIFPPETTFYAEPLSLASVVKELRPHHRQAWLKGVLFATRKSDVVFIDPDNGLEVKSISKHHNRGPKFCFYDELESFWQRGQSLVIYQHKNMHETAEMQILNRLAEMQRHFPSAAWMDNVYFPACGGRMFFIVMHPEHENSLSTKLLVFKEKWARFIKC